MDYLRVTDHEVIVAAILHDIVEDKPEWTLARVAAEYGQRVAMLVDYLSKPPKELFGGDKEKRDIEYHKKFHFAPREFFLIKLPDRLHNLVTLWDCAESKRERKITETELFYLPFAEQHGILIHELEESIRELREASAVLA